MAKHLAEVESTIYSNSAHCRDGANLMPRRPHSALCTSPRRRTIHASKMQRLVYRKARFSLLLAASTARIFLALARDDLPKHHHPVAIHKGDAGEALAILEGVAHQGLLRLEAALRHLVRLQRVRIL